jgi:hypothetical protein
VPFMIAIGVDEVARSYAKKAKVERCKPKKT